MQDTTVLGTTRDTEINNIGLLPLVSFHSSVLNTSTEKSQHNTEYEK